MLPVPPDLAGDDGQTIEAVRRAWDPVMADRIGPHVTIVHDVIDADRACRVLDAVADELPAFSIAFAGTACWASPPIGVYLHVVDLDGGVAALRARLAQLEAPGWTGAPYEPHVTLVHPKWIEPGTADAAWAALRRYDIEATVTIDAVATVKLGDERWDTIATHRLAAARE